MQKPCSWPIDKGCLPQAAPDADPALMREACDQAVMVLWALSGRRFGLCPQRVRPCPYGCWPFFRPVHTGPWAPLVVAWSGDNWINMACGCLGAQCRRTGPGMVHLPGPVAEIIEVGIGSTVLGENEYKLEGDVLYRTSVWFWPNQDLSRPTGFQGTWYVDYLRGDPPPAGAGRMAAVLAGEFYNQCTGGKCRLPRNVRSVSRGGLSYEIYDPGQIYSQGKTGLPEIDLWLAAVNPYHLLAPPSVI